MRVFIFKHIDYKPNAEKLTPLPCMTSPGGKRPIVGNRHRKFTPFWRYILKYCPSDSVGVKLMETIQKSKVTRLWCSASVLTHK